MSATHTETENSVTAIDHPVIVAETPVENGIRIVPVEDFGLGVARLISGGVSGLVAMGKGDALSDTVKKATTEINAAVNKTVGAVTGLLNRAKSAPDAKTENE